MTAHFPEVDPSTGRFVSEVVHDRYAPPVDYVRYDDGDLIAPNGDVVRVSGGGVAIAPDGTPYVSTSGRQGVTVAPDGVPYLS